MTVRGADEGVYVVVYVLYVMQSTLQDEDAGALTSADASFVPSYCRVEIGSMARINRDV